jgi:large subunit ribosomal protein L4
MATSVDVIDATGKKSGSIELPAAVFDVVTNVPLMHQVVVAQLAAARQGTHKTKRRGEVSGAGRKPFKQKGTGRARQGSIRAPQHRGGGIVHGPVPRDYSQRTPKKMIQKALLSALSDRARADRIHVVKGLGTDSAPSTKVAAKLMAQTAPGRNVLVVIGRDDVNGQKSVRNLPGIHAVHPDQLNVYDVLNSDDIIFTAEALETFVASKADAGAKEGK